MKNIPVPKTTTKVCFTCKTEHPWTHEFFYRSNVRYLQNECKSCNKVRRAKWWKSAAGKLSSTNTKLQARFGITADQYNARLREQGGKCLVCSATSSCMGHKLAVDHDHKTGTIRGLLCKSCNIAIGNMHDDPQRLRNAASYLEKFNTREK